MNSTICPTVVEIESILRGYVSDIFATLFNATLRPAVNGDIRSSRDTLIVASVNLVGDWNGVIRLSITARFANRLTSKMLGLDVADRPVEQLVEDAIGELCSMAAGSTSSYLRGDGTCCTQSPPLVEREISPFTGNVNTSECVRFSMAYEHELLLLEIIANEPCQTSTNH